MKLSGKCSPRTEIVENVILTTYKDFRVRTEISTPIAWSTNKREEVFAKETINNIAFKLRTLMYPEKLSSLKTLSSLPKDTFEKERVYHYYENRILNKEMKVFVGKPNGLMSHFENMGCGIVPALTPSLLLFGDEKIAISSIIFIQEIEDYAL